MTLHIPDTLAGQSGCSAPELMFGLVVGLFFQGRLSMAQAGEALGLSRPEFMEQFHELGLPVPYSSRDAESDLAVIDRLWPETRESAHP